MKWYSCFVLIRGDLNIILVYFWFPELLSKWRKLLRGFSTMLFRGNISISVDLKSVILVILCRLTSHLSRERTNFVRINFLAQIQQSALILRPQKEVSSPQKCPWGETERRQGVTGETHETAFWETLTDLFMRHSCYIESLWRPLPFSFSRNLYRGLEKKTIVRRKPFLL